MNKMIFLGNVKKDKSYILLITIYSSSSTPPYSLGEEGSPRLPLCPSFYISFTMTRYATLDDL